MRRAAGGIWAHGPGERDPEGSLVAGVPFLIRDEGPNTVGGDPFWGIYDLVGGESDSVDTTFRRYVTHTKPAPWHEPSGVLRYLLGR